MSLTVLTKGMFGSNTYILENQGECAVIDCGNPTESIVSVLKDKGLKVKYIILTHGHVDHILNAGKLKEALGGSLLIHEDEADLYFDKDANCSRFLGREELVLANPDKLLKDGDILTLGDKELKIIHTPGHSPGSISILCDNMLFTGDTLFAMSVGRTDLYGGSMKQLVESIRDRLFVLDGNTVVYPGHGPSTTIEYEREHNPYV